MLKEPMAASLIPTAMLPMHKEQMAVRLIITIILTPPPFKALMAVLRTLMTVQVQPQQRQEAPLIGAMVRALLQVLQEVRLAGLMVQGVPPLQPVAILEAGVDKSI